MNIPKTILIIIILILLAGNVFFGYQYLALQKELEATKATIKTQQINEKILDYTKLFIEKVLKAETEVDFETRLKLENAVRNLDDKEILAQWQKFTESKTEAEAQTEIKNLLEMLINKIKAGES
jgi:hypothetical protein